MAPVTDSDVANDLRQQIGVLMDENWGFYRERKAEYRLLADTMRLEEKRYARTGAIPAGRFRVTGIVAEEKIRQMARDLRRRHTELEQVCQYQQDIIGILHRINNGDDIYACWEELHRLWEAFVETRKAWK